MIIKFKHIKKNKSINNIVLRLQNKGCRLYHVYDMVVLHRKSRKNKGKVLDKLGFWIPIIMKECYFFQVLNYIIESNVVLL